MANKVYVANWGSPVLLPLDLAACNFRIFSPGRTMKVKSIQVQQNIFDVTANLFIPQEQNTVLYFLLTIGNAPQKIGSTFENIGGTPLVDNGISFRMLRAGPLYFDSFFVSETLLLSMQLSNQSVLNSIQSNMSFMVEVEENISYL